MGAFSGFSATAIALVATQVPEERLGYALGWLNWSAACCRRRTP
jgi:DHA1 family multidrug resistance protein-like MFS transporter